MTDYEQRPLIGAAVAGAVLTPVAKELVKAGIGVAIEKASRRLDIPIDAVDVPKITVAVANAAADDPKLVNALNAEPAYQSRVVWGSVIAALGVVIPVVGKLFGWNIDGSQIVEFGSAIITLSGAGYALYGRLTKGLAPLFSRDK